MKKITALILGLLVFIPSLAHADMIAEGNHSVNSCLFIDNFSQFSDYTIVVSASGHSFPAEYILDATDEKYCLYGGRETTLLAVRKENIARLKSVNAGTNEPIDWVTSPENTKYLIPSNIQLHFDEQLSDKNPVSLELTNVMIDSITDSKVVAHVVRHTFFNANNQLLECSPSGCTTINSEKEIKSAGPFKDVNSPGYTSQPIKEGSAKQMFPLQKPSTEVQREPSSLFEPLHAREIIFVLFGIIGLGFAFRTWKK